ncbi:glycosyl hydrolase family 28-related protein [Fontivita pretiosa]|uniref:right-handed parallel beta-helix repeat-containing protein n=1 Tax=Fontivita pretiosa TaxID=2989684 RepID=UPI003D16CC14
MINVADFGAIPNDAGDDSYQIQRAINSSAAGDIIVFNAGEYRISRELTPLGGGRKYMGQGAAKTTLRQTGSQFVFHIIGNDVTITGFKFIGRGVFLDNPRGQMNENIVIDNNTFELYARGTNPNAVMFTTGLKNSRITNNYFDPISGDNGVYGYYWDNLVIANNAFMNGNEGIHVIDHSDRSRDLLIEQNYFSGLRRMGIEYQGGGWDTIIQDNFYENPVMTSVFSQNDSTFAYSIIADRSHNTIIRRNTAIAPERPDGTGVRVIFEVGGDNCLVEENYVIGGNHVLAGNDFHGTTSTIVRNNKWSGYLIGPSGRGVRFEGQNGPDVQLSWDINRGRPGPNRRFGGSEIPPTRPDPQPEPQPTLQAPLLNAVATALSEVELTWTDTTAGEVGFRLERSFDGQTWFLLHQPGPNRTRHFDRGLPPNIKVYYRIKAYGPFGETPYSNIATVTTRGLNSPSPTGTGTSPSGTPYISPPSPTTNPYSGPTTKSTFSTVLV